MPSWIVKHPLEGGVVSRTCVYVYQQSNAFGFEMVEPPIGVPLGAKTSHVRKASRSIRSSAELGGSLNVWEPAALQRVAGEQSRCCHPSCSHCLRLVHCLTLLSLAGLQSHSRSAPLGQQCRHRTRPSTWCLWCAKQQTFQQVCNRFGTSVESRGVAKLCIIETG